MMSVNADPRCPNGGHWNETAQMCVPDLNSEAGFSDYASAAYNTVNSEIQRGGPMFSLLGQATTGMANAPGFKPNVGLGVAGGAFSGLASGGLLGGIIGAGAGFLSSAKQRTEYENLRDLYERQRFNNKKISANQGYYAQFGGETPGTTPAQTEKGEIVLFPDNTLPDVMATKYHKNMKDDKITDMLPDGSYIFSNDKTMKFNVKDVEEKILGYGMSYYDEQGNYKTEEMEMEDFLPKSGKMTFAEAAEVLRKTIKTTGRRNDLFDIATDSENLETRVPYIMQLIAMQDEKNQAAGRVGSGLGPEMEEMPEMQYGSTWTYASKKNLNKQYGGKGQRYVGPDVRLQDYPEYMSPLEYEQKYLQSDKFRERATAYHPYDDNTNFTNPGLYGKIAQVRAISDNAGVEFRGDSKYSDSPALHGRRIVQMNPMSTYNFPKTWDGETNQAIMSHEIAHAQRLLPGEFMDIVPRNKILAQKGKQQDLIDSMIHRGNIPDDISSVVASKIDHEASPGETKSDIHALRYLMRSTGIYDDINDKSPITQEHINQMMSNPTFQKSQIWKRFNETYDPQDALHLLNTVTDTTSNQGAIGMAQYGGVLPTVNVTDYRYPFSIASDANDPRYKSYADSLYAYNISKDTPAMFTRRTMDQRAIWDATQKIKDPQLRQKEFFKLSMDFAKNVAAEDKSVIWPINYYIAKTGKHPTERVPIKTSFLPGYDMEAGIPKDPNYGELRDSYSLIFKKPVHPVFLENSPEHVAAQKQMQLAQAGLYSGKIDGIWGRKSKKAWEQLNASQQAPPPPPTPPKTQLPQYSYKGQPLTKEQYEQLMAAYTNVRNINKGQVDRDKYEIIPAKQYGGPAERKLMLQRKKIQDTFPQPPLDRDMLGPIGEPGARAFQSAMSLLSANVPKRKEDLVAPENAYPEVNNFLKERNYEGDTFVDKLKKFQESHGLIVDGIAGTGTLGAIDFIRNPGYYFDAIHNVESANAGDYRALNKNTGAAGRYQFVPGALFNESNFPGLEGKLKPDSKGRVKQEDIIKAYTGVSDMTEFLNSNKAQDDYATYYAENALLPDAIKAKRVSKTKLPLSDMIALVHFQGYSNAVKLAKDPAHAVINAENNMTAEGYLKKYREGLARARKTAKKSQYGSTWTIK